MSRALLHAQVLATDAGRGPDRGVAIGGVVDDDPAERTVIGHTVRHPGSIAPGEHALLSSDWHEDAIWERVVDESTAADARAA